MFVSEARKSLPDVFHMLPLHLQSIGLAGKACQGKTLAYLFVFSVSQLAKCFVNIGTWTNSFKFKEDIITEVTRKAIFSLTLLQSQYHNFFLLL
jgi:hypothetical protein